MMIQFRISPIDKTLIPALRHKIDNLTKPKGSLGMLEQLSEQIGLIQHSLSPELKNPCNILFGADHGITDEGVTVSPREVTAQQMLHFLRGGAGISFLCRQHGFRLVVVDAGVDFDFPVSSGIIDKKIRKATSNFRYGSAMSLSEFDEAIRRGAEVVDMVAVDGTNVVSFGEMGSGNTSAASLWMHRLTEIPLDKCVGAGAGLNSSGVSHKLEVLSDAVAHYRGSDDIRQWLAWFGGFELVMAVGAMLRAAELKMVIIVDGFIMTACIAAAAAISPAVLDYALFGHVGDESGHRLLLEFLHARPILALSMRLGEGSGAVCAYPIIDSAVRMINEMDTFEAVKVTKYF